MAKPKPPQDEPPDPHPDDVLRVMLNTPPHPHKPPAAKVKKTSPKKKKPA